MSEYQYYEFQAIDKPVKEKDLKALREISSRAQITPTSFVNTYNYGDFRSNPMKLMEKYFDAFIYVSNFGSRRFMLKVPQRLINFDLAKQYCFGENATAYQKSENLIFEFDSETEDYEWEEGEGWLSSLISLRSDILGGDFRCLYLGWLYCVQAGDFEEDEPEPPVPPNLNDLNGPLQSFVDFMRIDPDLIAVAAEESTFEEKGKDLEQISAWIRKLPEKEKDEILLRLVQGHAPPHIRAELMQRFRQTVLNKTDTETGEKTRSVGELLGKAEKYTAERKSLAAEKRAKERAKKEREEAIAREKYLNNLAKSENKVWEKVDALVITGQQAGYDEAVKLLVDLRDLSSRTKKKKKFKEKLENISDKYRRKTSFIRRLTDAGVAC
jgi:hypothetical protein